MSSVLKVDSIQTTSGSGFVIPPAGGIIQTQYTQFTGTNTVSLSALTDTVLTDLTVNITPVSASSVIHLQAHLLYEHGEDNDNGWNHIFFFYRDTTKLGHTQTGSNRLCGISMGTRTFYSEDDSSTPHIARYDYFDAPSTTSQITYTWQGYNHTNTDQLYWNYDNSTLESTNASITLMEIAQ